MNDIEFDKKLGRIDYARLNVLECLGKLKQSLKNRDYFLKEAHTVLKELKADSISGNEELLKEYSALKESYVLLLDLEDIIKNEDIYTNDEDYYRSL